MKALKVMATINEEGQLRDLRENKVAVNRVSTALNYSTSEG